MEGYTYNFETHYEPPHEQPAVHERSIIVDPSETGNQAPQYQRLHVGDVAVGSQMVVFYEQGSEAGIATLQKTEATDGLHGWNLRTVSYTDAGEAQRNSYGRVGIATATKEGFMNRHCFIEPGDELLVDGQRTVSIGTIASVHTVELPERPPVAVHHKTLRTRFLEFVQAHRPFARAA